MTAQVRRLTASLDKQQELLAAQQLRVQKARRELATGHLELAKLPEETLPAPKKIPMELHAIMVACERLQGQGVVVTDCKGAAVIANKLKLGLRRPRGRHRTPHSSSHWRH
eukprot:3104397-Amphidinium_carterae.1